jgi:hypothetical protein
MNSKIQEIAKRLDILSDAASVGSISPEYGKAFKKIYDAIVDISALLNVYFNEVDGVAFNSVLFRNVKPEQAKDDNDCSRKAEAQEVKV